MITKEEVMMALEVIEKYNNQKKERILQLERDIDNRPIDILGLTTREYNGLVVYEIETIGDLKTLNTNTLLKIRGLGKKSIIGINEKLKNIGVDKTFRIGW